MIVGAGLVPARLLLPKPGRDKPCPYDPCVDRHVPWKVEIGRDSVYINALGKEGPNLPLTRS